MTVLSDEINRKQTAAYIDADPLVVFLTRREEVDDGAGGKLTEADSSARRIRVRLVGIRTTTRTVEEGRQEIVGKALVALPGSDILLGDRCVLGETVYEVVTLSQEPSWRLVAELASRG